MSHKFKAGDKVRFGKFEGVLESASGGCLKLAHPSDGLYVYFNPDGSLGLELNVHKFGPILTLIEAAPEKPARKTIHVAKYPNTGDTVYKEVLPGDIGPFTKAEAREWLTKGIAKMHDMPETSNLDYILTGMFIALGIAEEPC